MRLSSCTTSTLGVVIIRSQPGNKPVETMHYRSRSAATPCFEGHTIWATLMVWLTHCCSKPLNYAELDTRRRWVPTPSIDDRRMRLLRTKSVVPHYTNECVRQAKFPVICDRVRLIYPLGWRRTHDEQTEKVRRGSLSIWQEISKGSNNITRSQKVLATLNHS